MGRMRGFPSIRRFAVLYGSSSVVVCLTGTAGHCVRRLGIDGWDGVGWDG